jgi:hypothetical protein
VRSSGIEREARGSSVCRGDETRSSPSTHLRESVRLAVCVLSRNRSAGIWPSGGSPRLPGFPVIAFSLLVYTGQPISARLFLEKRRTSLLLPVQSRSENALKPPVGAILDARERRVSPRSRFSPAPLFSSSGAARSMFSVSMFPSAITINLYLAASLIDFATGTAISILLQGLTVRAAKLSGASAGIWPRPTVS